MSIQAPNASITGLHLNANAGQGQVQSANAQAESVLANPASTADDVATALEQLEQSMAAMREAAEAGQEVEAAYLEAQRLMKQLIAVQALKTTVHQVEATNVVSNPQDFGAIAGIVPVVKPSDAPAGTFPAHTAVPQKA
jgi:hypothetical protein